MKENREIKRMPNRIIIMDDKRKFDAIQMSNSGVAGKLNEKQTRALNGIKELQKEFQEKYCPSCIKYDLTKKDFISKNHPSDKENCYNHWTDILGACWNYHKRE